MKYYVYYITDEWENISELMEFPTKKEALNFIYETAINKDKKNPNLDCFRLIRGHELKIKFGKVIERIEGVFCEEDD